MKSVQTLPRTTPEAQGISSSAILGFVAAANQTILELHSLMLVRHGSVVAEGWWAPYAAHLPHMLFSLSKSFTSTAVGLAASEGLLTLDDPVLPFFPEEAPARVSANLAALRIRHLLSMSTGHAQDTTQAMYMSKDGNWAKAFLELPIEYEPGTHFLYNTGATYMLSAIVQKVSGQRLLNYLRPRLFTPLGIQRPTWESCPRGINTGGFGLSITTEDIARFGQLYLQDGVWNGKRLLPQGWVKEATATHISNGSSPESDWEQGYGFQFWRCRHGAYRGDGAFGQYCIVMPEQDAVLAITAAVPDMQAVLNLVWKHLLPAMGAKKLPEAPARVSALRQSLNGLELLPPTGQSAPPLAAEISGRQYTLQPNPFKFKAVSFEQRPDAWQVTFGTGRRSQTLVLGHAAWVNGKTPLFDYRHITLPVVSSATWTDAHTLQLTVRSYETPFYYTLDCHFDAAELAIDGRMNLFLGPTQLPPLKGRLAQ